MRRPKRRAKQRPNLQPVHPSWLRRYRFHILVAILACLIFARFRLDYLLSPTSPMENRYSAIHYGMTAQEVEEILGNPNHHDDDEYKVWTSQWGIIAIHLKDGRVSDKNFSPLKSTRPRPFGP